MRILGCAFLAFILAATCSAQETNFATGPRYLLTSGSPLFAHSLATPTLSFETALPQAGTSEPSVPQASAEQYQAVSDALDLQRQAYLPTVYYGAPTATAVEINIVGSPEAESLQALPASITETGVTAFTDAETLRQFGYGVTLAEAAQRAKNRKAAPHKYTNSDIERLRSGS